MTTVLIIALAVAIAAFTCSALLLFARLIAMWREDRRRERERMAARHERMAAHNGRPHTDAVTLARRES